ncbi:MAG: TraR/DksA family transcriptional regulator [bacterium]
MTDVERFKSRLLSLKSDMTRRISAIQKDIRHEDLSADWSEQATERENDEVLDSLGNASEEELVMINKALERIDSGEYFCCVKCGGPIPEARLEVLPFSTRCVQCAE